MSLLDRSLIIADVPPGDGYTRNFEYCFKITNLNKYPNHLLFAQVGSVTSNPTTIPYVLVKSGQCIPVNGYRPSANISAIAKNKVSAKYLKNTSSGTIPNNPKLQKSLVQGIPRIVPPDSLPIINEGKKIEAGFKIQSIDSHGLKLVPVKNSTPILNIVLFPAIGAVIIGGMIWHHKRQVVSATGSR
jgi:hypothetical protein